MFEEQAQQLTSHKHTHTPQICVSSVSSVAYVQHSLRLVIKNSKNKWEVRINSVAS